MESVSARAGVGGSIVFYRLIRAVLYIFYRFNFDLRYYGSEKVPSPSDPRGVILAPNHESYLDPPILGVTLKRRVTYLAKEYLFKHPFVGFVLRSIGTFPIKSESGHDVKSIRDLIRLLKEGHCVAVFPEGTRSEDGRMKEPEGGLGFLAMKSGAWVVPVFIEGSYAAFPKGAKSFKRSPIRIFYGEPFIPAQNKTWEDMNDYMAVSQAIMKEIRALKEKNFTRQ